MENLAFENIRINGELRLNLARLTPMDATTPRIDGLANSTFSGRAITNQTVLATSNGTTGADGRRGGSRLVVPGEGPYIHNVMFKNVEVYGEELAATGSKGGRRPVDKVATGVVLFQGLSEKHDIRGILFDNVTRHGKPLAADSPDVQIGKFAKGVEFIP